MQEKFRYNEIGMTEVECFDGQCKMERINFNVVLLVNTTQRKQSQGM